MLSAFNTNAIRTLVCRWPTGASPRRKRVVASRSGYVYVAVLFTTLIVMATVAVSVSLSTANVRAQNDRGRRMDALRIAESELQRLAAHMRTSAQWRSQMINDEFTDWREWNVGPSASGETRHVRHRYTDSDGNLNDDSADSVDLTVHARIGTTESAVSVTLEPDPGPLDVLNYSVTSSDDLHLESGALLNTERAVQVYDDCRTNSSGRLITPELQCSGKVAFTVRGDRTASSVSVPSYNVLNRYRSVGTQISAWSIPYYGYQRRIQDIVLSPSANPYGANDAAGIYWIDAWGQTIRISNCRIDAILVISGAAEVILSGGITWNYPNEPEAILVTDSSIRIENVNATLSEEDRDVNFNPTGSPYRGTLTNSTKTDTYPTELRGFVYTTQDILIQPLDDDATLPITGSLLGSDIEIYGNVSVRSLDEWNESPPIGFADRTPMRFVRGTFRRIPSP
tara:strand:- start:107440 stop:108801 length:1362 start_codon:yes stop_codon:yes gene_type:complete